MAIDYLSSFNGGELSPYLDSRVDIDKYQSGCRTLENMYVLPSGGVERRIGSEYIAESLGVDGVRLIPFSFTEDESYVVEFTSGVDNKIRIYDGNGYTNVELDSPFTGEELHTIKYCRVFDILYLISSFQPPQLLKRTNLSPLEFEITPTEFTYPPLLDENTDKNNTISFEPVEWVPDVEYVEGSQVQYLGLFYDALANIPASPTFIVANWTETTVEHVNTDEGNIVTLHSSDGIFEDGHVDSYFRTSHQRGNGTIAGNGSVSGDPDFGYEYYTEEIHLGDRLANVNYRLWGNSELQYDSGIQIWTKEGIDGSYGTVVYENFAYGSGIEQISAGTDVYMKIQIRGGTGYTPKAVKIHANASFSAFVGGAKRVTFTSVVDAVSEELDVSFSDWTVTTGNKWLGSLELQKSTDGGGSWSTELIIGDTTGTGTAADDAKNFTISSPGKENKTTLIRLNFEHDDGTIDANMINDTLNSDELYKIVEVLDSNDVLAIVIQPPINTYATSKWNEGAFSNVRGFPNAIDIFENRVIYSGTVYDPSTVWMSVIGDFDNFLLGDLDDEAVKIIPNNAEPTQWLLSRSEIFQGSNGGMSNIFPIDNSKTIGPANVKSAEVTSFGSSNIQAIFANGVTVYMQRLGKKLRSIVYSDEENTFNTEDLTILSGHITESGVVELGFQKTPDQIIWCLRNDGTLAALTYERVEAVAGWHHHDFGGEVKSITVRHASGEDELWIAIQRKNGLFIEKVGGREFSDDLLDAWYVDSGVKTVLSDCQSGDITIDTNTPSHVIVSNGEEFDGTYYYDSIVNGRPKYVKDTFTIEYNSIDDRWQIASSGGTNLFFSSNITTYIPPTVWDTTWDDYDLPNVAVFTAVLVTKTDHGLVDGNIIKLSDTGDIQLDDKLFTVADATTNTYTLKISDGIYFSYDLSEYTVTDTIIMAGAGEEPNVNDTYHRSDIFNDKYDYSGVSNRYNIYWETDFTGGAWTVGYSRSLTYTTDGNLNPANTDASVIDTWNTDMSLHGVPSVRYVYDNISLSCEFCGNAKIWTGFDHLEGEILQVQGDGGYAGIVTVEGGIIETDAYYNQIVAGLPYVSIIQPMFIEPTGGTYSPMASNKILNKTVLKFYRTIGALVGTVSPKDATTAIDLDIDVFKVNIPEGDKENVDDYNTEQVIFRTTNDAMGEPITPFTGDHLVYIDDDWGRLKSLYCVQNLPMPMTVMSMAVSIKTGKDV